MTTRGVAGVRERLERSLERWQEPGAAELCEAVGELLGGASRPGEGLQLERLKPAVYRLKVGSTPGRALIAKRHPPAVAQTDRLVVERWLPALDLGDGCPQLLAAAAEREGSWVWHVYEDLGDGNLAAERLPWRLDAAVDFMAELHLRAAGHPLLPEARWRARDHGVHFFTSNVRDAATLPRGRRAEGLAASRPRRTEPPVSHGGVCALRPLRRLGGDGPAARRRRVGHRRAHGFRALVPGAPAAPRRMTAPAKLLIVTADDFGISRGVNRGIAQAHREGILTSTSLMVNRPASVQAADVGRACRALNIGLHLELDAGGARDVPTELDRQLARFTELVGVPAPHAGSPPEVPQDPPGLAAARAGR